MPDLSIRIDVVVSLDTSALEALARLLTRAPAPGAGQAAPADPAGQAAAPGGSEPVFPVPEPPEGPGRAGGQLGGAPAGGARPVPLPARVATWRTWMTPEREAVMRDLYPKGAERAAIIERMAALPGPAVSVERGRFTQLATALGLRRLEPSAKGVRLQAALAAKRKAAFAQIARPADAPAPPPPPAVRADFDPPGAAPADRPPVANPAEPWRRWMTPEREAALREGMADGTPMVAIMNRIFDMPGPPARDDVAYLKSIAKQLGLARPGAKAA